jgi:hypothetical protein
MRCRVVDRGCAVHARQKPTGNTARVLHPVDWLHRARCSQLKKKLSARMRPSDGNVCLGVHRVQETGAI